MIKNIALIYGGNSSEREISIQSAKAIYESLKKLKYNTFLIEIDEDLPNKLSKLKPDLAFIACHGKYGEDGCVQGFLECLNIPYTHSGVMACSICMHKPTAKVIFNHLGIKIAHHKILTKSEILSNKILHNKKYVLKPTSEGSSVNVFIFEKEHNFTEKNYPFKGEIMLEEYIPGKELHVGIVTGKALGIVEIIPKTKQFYDYEAKYTSGLAEHIIPAKTSEETYNKCLIQSEAVYKFLKCKGIARADFRYNEENNELIMLEFNTHPGFTKLSLVPEIAKKCYNITFDQLVEKIIDDTIQNSEK